MELKSDWVTKQLRRKSIHVPNADISKLCVCLFFYILGMEEKQMKELLEATNSTQHTYVHQVMYQNVPSSTMHSSQSWKPPKKSNTGRWVNKQ